MLIELLFHNNELIISFKTKSIKFQREDAITKPNTLSGYKFQRLNDAIFRLEQHNNQIS